MEPKEKAKELVRKFIRHSHTISDSKKNALIAVDEVIQYFGWATGIRYWEEVKQEIEKL